MSARLVQMVVLGASAVAWAQDPMAPPPAEPMVAPTETDVTATAAPTTAAGPLTKEGWSTKIVDRPIALSQGMIEVAVPVLTGLNKGDAGGTINTALAVYYGVTDLFQLSLHHGTGVCYTGCDKTYNDVGLRGTYSLLGRGGSFELAAWAQVDATNLSEGTVKATVGPFINWVIGTRGLLLSNPGISFGLTDREGGNKESFGVPVYAYFQATDNIAPYLSGGISSPFSNLSDSYMIPAGVGVFYGINNRVDVTGEFGFPDLGGKNGSADNRAFLLQLSVRPL